MIFRLLNTYFALAAGSALLLSGLRVSATEPAQPTQACPADSFVDTVGINIGSLLTGGTSYPNFNTLETAIKNGGFRFVRLATGPPTSGTLAIPKIKQLVADTGVKVIWILDPPTDTRPDSTYWVRTGGASIVSFLSTQFAPGQIWGLEMCNEIDNFYRPYYWHPGDTQHLNNTPTSSYYWGKYITAATPSTHEALISSAASWIAGLPLIGPSLITHGDYACVGDLGSSLNYGCVHPYSAWAPENTGYGGIFYNYKYGSLEANFLGFAENCQSPGRGAIATEGGNSITPLATSTNSSWTWANQARYVPRFYLKAFQVGSRATCLWTLNDNNNRDNRINFGLLDYQFNPKPAYNYVKNLVGILKDPGTSFQPDSISMTLSGATSEVYTQLFQKANGTFYLCIWLAAQLQDPNNGAPIAVNPRNVTLTVPSVTGAALLYTFDSHGDDTATRQTWSAGGNFALTVQPQVMVLQFDSALAHTGATPQIYQAEKLAIASRTAPYETFPDVGNAVENVCARLDGTMPGDNVVYEVPNIQAERYSSIDVRVRTSGSGGNVQVQVADSGSGPWVNVGKVTNTYSTTTGYTDITGTNIAFLRAGTKYFKLSDTMSASNTYKIEPDQIAMTPTGPVGR